VSFMVEDAEADINHRLQAETAGAVQRVSDHGAITRWLQSYGADDDFGDDGVGKAALAAMLERDDLPPVVRSVLLLRQMGGKSSATKYRAILARLSHDGRLRGVLVYCGAAATGRWCLAEGTPILVRTATGTVMERPVQHVRPDDQVWDGIEWVNHEGVVFSGEKDVIEHDGVTATADHHVFLSDNERITLGEAKRLNLPLWQGIPR
jgi:hypothetical protein